MCSDRAVRLRRDFAQVLRLIKSHALLHIYHRERNERGQIVATIEDYAIVWDLVADLVAEGVSALVSDAVRETVEIVSDLVARKDYPVTVAKVSQALGIDKSSASRRVSRAISQGWIVNLEDKKYRPRRLDRGDRLPERESVLPHPDVLKNRETGPETATMQPHQEKPMVSGTSRLQSPMQPQCNHTTTGVQGCTEVAPPLQPLKTRNY
jgi:hypothetical protein